MKKYIFIICFIPLLSELHAQDDNLDEMLFSKDTVFILLSENVKASVNGKRSINPNNKYPEDMSRRYSLDSDPVSFNNIYYTDLDLEIPYYFVESKEKFHRRDFISSDDLANKSVKQILEVLNNRVLMMVDPSFSDSINYYVVRVFRYAGEE